MCQLAGLINHEEMLLKPIVSLIPAGLRTRYELMRGQQARLRLSVIYHAIELRSFQSDILFIQQVTRKSAVRHVSRDFALFKHE